MSSGYNIFGHDPLESGIAYIGVLAPPEENYNKKFTNLQRAWKNGTEITKVFLVAYAAYMKEDRIWATKITEIVYGIKKEKIEESEFRKLRSKIFKAITFLHDYFLIKGEYGETEKGCAGRLYFIDENGLAPSIYKEILEKGRTVEELFLEEYFKKFGGEKSAREFKKWLERNFK